MRSVKLALFSYISYKIFFYDAVTCVRSTQTGIFEKKNSYLAICLMIISFFFSDKVGASIDLTSISSYSDRPFMIIKTWNFLGT